MARRYAGILGLAAFAAVALRGALHGASLENTFLSAVVSLLAFATIGTAVGRIAQTTVEQAVQQRFAADMKSPPAADKQLADG